MPLPISLRSSLRSLPPAAWILFAGTFINRFGSFVLPFLIIYVTGLGYSIPQAGFAVGMYGLGNLVSAGVGGWMTDRFGRRNTIVLSMFSSAAAMLVLSQVHGLRALCITAALAGLTTELYRPASGALLADLVPQGNRVTAFAVYRFAVNLGFAAGPAMAGLLAQRSFFLLFAGDALTSLVFGFIALGFLPNGLRHVSSEEPSRWGEAIRSVFRDRPFIRFLLASVCITLVDFQMGSTFALHIKASGLQSSTYGLLISVNGLLIVLFELSLTRLTQTRNARSVLALGFLLSGIGFALTGISHTVPALVAVITLFTVGEMIASPVAGAYVADLAPERYRGRYMGIWGGTWSLGLMLGPPIGTLVFSRSPATLWWSCGLLGVVAAWLLLEPFSGTVAGGTPQT